MIRFAVIAAGEGSRLKQEGIVPDKPMVCIHGEPLLHRLVRIFSLAGASAVDIIVNAHMPEGIAYMPSLDKSLVHQQKDWNWNSRKNSPSDIW